jgi:hypothetical protein
MIELAAPFPGPEPVAVPSDANPPIDPPGFEVGFTAVLVAVFNVDPPCPPGAVIIEPNVVSVPFAPAAVVVLAPAPPVPIVTVYVVPGTT